MTRTVAPTEQTSTRPSAPIIKWAGGKGQLIPVLTPLLPARFVRYFEPFLGGGAVFFYLASTRGIPAFLSDLNPELINFYQVLRDNTEEFLEALRNLAETYKNNNNEGKKAMYYAWRNADRTSEFATWSPLRRALRFYFLNKTAYNGLYRTNRQGHFNVPWGQYMHPSLYVPEILRRAARLLREHARRLAVEPFEKALERPKAGDFVYLDPPYVPLSATSRFTAYTREGFTLEDQRRLANICRELDQRGVLFMISNSDTPLVHELYRGFHIQRVWARRSINARGDKRLPISELVIRNYLR